MNRKLFIPLGAVALSLASSFLLRSGQASIQWTSLGPSMDPDNIGIETLAVDPSHPSHLYLAANSRVFESLDGGETWMRLSSLPAIGPIVKILIDLKDASRIFIWHSRGFLRTIDRGRTWTQLSLPVNPSWIKFDPTNSTVLYAGNSGSIYKSEDDGIAWTIFFRDPNLTLGPLAIDPIDPRIMYLVAGSPYTSYSLRKTMDRGLHWEILAAPQQYTPADGDLLVIDPTNSSMVYWAGIYFFLRSDDSGRTWQDFSPTPYPMWKARFIHLDPIDPATVFFVTEESTYRSCDRGQTWDNLTIQVNRLFMDPLSSSNLYVTNAEGLHKSTDGGLSWKPMPLPEKGMAVGSLAIDPFNAAHIFTGGYESFDFGKHWQERISGGGHLIFHPVTKGTIYGFSGGFVYKSTDGGGTWSSTSIEIGHYGSFIGAAIDPRAPSVLYASYHIQTNDFFPPQFAYLWRKTEDGGLAWNAVSENAGLHPRGVDPHTSTLYANGKFNGANESGFWKSADRGAHWTPVKMPDPNIHILEFDPQNPGILYAGGGLAGGVFKSTDDGKSWKSIMEGLTQPRVLKIQVNPLTPSSLYLIAGSYYAEHPSLFFSKDGGAHWLILNSPEGTSINDIAIDPANPLRIYAATGDGVFTAEMIEASCWMNPSRIQLQFGSNPEFPPPAQRVTIGQVGAGSMSWRAEANVTWIRIEPSAGQGAGVLSVGVDPRGLASGGEYQGTIRIDSAEAGNSPLLIEVSLHIYASGTTSAPFGFFDTPVDGTAGVTGAIAVTGWALDDVGVRNVRIYRDPVGDEEGGEHGFIYIGDTVFVEGARPDVEQRYPFNPENRRAGWGYMLLSNVLPGRGNGSFTLHALATDVEGHLASLGSKTIVCENAQAVLPFGTIDTPTQGGAAWGTDFANFGWALTPPPKFIPIDGSTITVWVDGLPLGHPSYNHFRIDVATLFPGHVNSNGAIGLFHVDTTGFDDGMHTIAWSVEDSSGAVSGIGSRFFTIQNAGGGIPASGGTNSEQAGTVSPRPRNTASIRPNDMAGLLEDPAGIPYDDASPLFVKTGYDLIRPAEPVFPGENGIINLKIKELERITIYLSAEDAVEATEELFVRLNQNAPFAKLPRTTDVPETLASYSAFLLVGSERRPLPIGATFDAVRGILYWQAGPGFIGFYDFLIVSDDEVRGRFLKKLRIEIQPQRL